MGLPKEYRIVLGLALVFIAIAAVMISWSPDDNIAREIDEEPEITVYFHETKDKQTMKLEEYLMGVVAGEMFPDWPIEAYAAQAIFSRSFTMAFIAEGGLKDKYGTDISTNIEKAQAYNSDAVTPEIRQAVEMTKGEVMTYDNRYVKGWFHAYSGGMTTSAKEGLNYQEPEPPYIKSVDFGDNEYAPDDVTHWQVDYDADELQQLLATAGIDVGELKNLEVTGKGKTNRITEIKISGTEGIKTMHGADFRIAVDSTRMRSTLVSKWEFADGVLHIEGRGYGHGVGLSQWDAYKMAKEGKSPQEIATSFFNNVEIKKLYN
ncbi:MAG: SpoIID/LytB domain-containing protein [Firmicutes bacterium]|nr:SpoIID/LytB domain-containing protein [Bacillota bacterium]